jgi:hypothetical protein
MVREEPTRSGDAVPRPRQTNKKQQIMALYVSGIVDIEDLATITNTRASYVGKVLQDAGLIHGYFDLYTSTAHPMNVYSKLFAGKLGFRDEAAARRSVAILEQVYEQFAKTGDRAGQHHALSMALVMFDRARWTGKMHEADFFGRWLVAHLTSVSSAGQDNTTATTTRITEETRLSSHDDVAHDESGLPPG